MKTSTIASALTLGSLLNGANSEASDTNSKVVVQWSSGSSLVTSEVIDGIRQNVDSEGSTEKTFAIESGATTLDPVYVAGSWKQLKPGTDARLDMKCDFTVTPSATEGGKTFHFRIDPDGNSIGVDQSKEVTMKCARFIEVPTNTAGGKSEPDMDHGEL